MTKRVATSELNRDNWDQDDDAPKETEIGIAKADEPELKRRLIIAGRRRLNPNASKPGGFFSGFGGFKPPDSSSSQDPNPIADANEPKMSLFSGFGGFKPSSTEKNQDSTNLPTNAAPVKSKDSHMNGTAPHCLEENEKVIVVDIVKDTTTSATKKCKVDNNDGKKDTSAPQDSNKQHKQFCKFLKALNEGVLKWVDQHVTSNPFVDLTPVFNDYFSHMTRLEEKFNYSMKTKSDLVSTSASFKPDNPIEDDKKRDDKLPSVSFAPKFPVQSTATVSSTLSFGFSSEKLMSKMTTSFDEDRKAQPINIEPPTFPSFTNGISNLTNQQSMPKFTFGQSALSYDNGKPQDGLLKSNTTSATSGALSTTFKFAFGNAEKSATLNGDSSAQPGLFTFLNSANQNGTACNGSETTSEDQGGDDDNAEYQPPVAESVTIEDEDAFYSIKCKLFYKPGDKYAERGVGTLYLKKLDSGKTQLLIRNDTALGNILLNVCLTESLPCSRVKNNLNLICVPNPPILECKQNPADPPAPKIDPSEPMAMLIRVKGVEEAQQLLEKIEQAKKMI